MAGKSASRAVSGETGSWEILGSESDRLPGRDEPGLDPHAHGDAACLTRPRACLTGDVELLVGDLRLQVDAAPLLRVVHPAEAGHVDHALFVHVHVAGCEPGKRRVRLCRRARASPVLWCASTSENELPSNSMLRYNVFGDTKNC